MNRPYSSFLKNLQRALSLISIEKVLSDQVTSAIDTSDILRASYVLAVSALDTYVHETVLTGMMQIYDGLRPIAPGYERSRIELGIFSGLTSINSAQDSVHNSIREQHSYLSYQNPEKIADAIRCVTDKKLWIEVSAQLNKDPQAIKGQLSAIVDRRNKIAHEADIDPTFGTLWPIYFCDVEKSISFINSIVDEINIIVDLDSYMESPP